MALLKLWVKFCVLYPFFQLNLSKDKWYQVEIEFTHSFPFLFKSVLSFPKSLLFRDVLLVGPKEEDVQDLFFSQLSTLIGHFY